MANKHLIHAKSVQTETNGAPKAPAASRIEYGEIAVNYLNGKERLFIKNNNNEIVSFTPFSESQKELQEIFEGYLKTADGKFYKTKSGSTYSDVLTGKAENLYVDKDTEKIYRWNGSAYVEVSAGGSNEVSKLINLAIYGQETKPSGASTPVMDVTYDSSSKKIQKKIGSTTSDVVTLSTVATSGSYNDLSNKPTIPAAQVNSDWNETNTSSKAYIANKPTIPAAQVNADWNASSGVAQILNKPTNLVTTNDLGTSVASLDSSGKVPSTQLPSYVDDVIEGYYYNSKFYKEAAHTTEITPETGKIYVDLSSEKTYRWSGNAYVAIGSSDIEGIKVGTSGSPIAPSGGYITIPAYETGAQVNTVTGVKGSAESNYRTGNIEITAANIGLGNVGNFKAVSTVANQGLSSTEKDNARANIGAGTSNLALGTTNNDAYRGDYGNTAYTHATDSSRLTTAQTEALYKIATTAQGHVASATAVTKADLTALGIVGSVTAASGSNIGSVGTPTATSSTDANGNTTITFDYLKGATGTNGTSAYWFTGTAVTGTGTNISASVTNSKAGDMYLNTSTYNVYKATAANKWDYVCNIKGIAGTAAGFGTPTGSVDANVGTPSVTITASGTDTAKVFDFEFKNLKGEPGTNGTNGTNGTDGTSAYWFSGTAVTGTGTNISANVSGSKAGDMYLNTSTDNVYKATAANKWDYVCNIKGQNATTTSVFSTSANGLAPAASGTGATDKFLKGDGTWAEPAGTDEVLIGSTAPSSGSTIELFVDTSEDAPYVDIGNTLRGTVSVVAVSANLNNQAPAANLAADSQLHVIYRNAGNSNFTVSFVSSYLTPNGQALTLTCPAGGYCEANFYNDGTYIYVRGL